MGHIHAAPNVAPSLVPGTCTVKRFVGTADGKEERLQGRQGKSKPNLPPEPMLLFCVEYRRDEVKYFVYESLV